MNVKIRIYAIPLTLYNLQCYNSIRGIIFKNFLGITFSGTKNTEIDTSTYFILFSYINSTDPIGIKNMFENQETHELELSKYINNSLIENNLFGHELVGIKILYFYDILQSGIFLLSKNKGTQININDTLTISDIIQFKINSNQGASFGNYYFEFAGVIQEPSSYDELKKYARNNQYLKQNLNQDLVAYNDESISDFDDSEFYLPLSYIGRSSIFNYTIESCFKTCSNCNGILGDSNGNHCTKCNQYFSFIHEKGKKCLDFCDNEKGYYLQQDTHKCLKDIPSEDYCLDFNKKIFKKYFYKCKT